MITPSYRDYRKIKVFTTPPDGILVSELGRPASCLLLLLAAHSTSPPLKFHGANAILYYIHSLFGGDGESRLRTPESLTSNGYLPLDELSSLHPSPHSPRP